MTKNLRPEHRMDKNGKRVLRWVADEFTDAKGVKLPPAKIAMRKAQLDAREIIFPGDDYIKGNVVKDHVIQYLEKMPDVLSAVLEAVQSDEDLAQNMRDLMAEPYRLTGTPVEESEDIFKRALAVQPHAKRILIAMGLEEDVETTRDVMFRMEKVLLDMGIDTKDSSLVRAAIIVSYMEGFPYDENMLPIQLWEEEKDDIIYIARNIDAVEALAPELQRRETYDSEVIEEMLSSASKSLSTGAL